ncbi:MAG TPA: hypothetical protein VKM72_10625 [Thermoanaerobaculia bacterium]|nr:hypothetical protein [Thermoanaerobaculia bacterium]
MQKNLRCLLLCEDIEQERLLRPILERRFRRVYVEPRKPHGGVSFVLQRIERLAAYIRQHQQEAVGLLVVVDGDTAGLRRRLEEIRASAGFTGAEWERKIAQCVPSRTIETWIMWLCGEREVDEQTEYKAAFRRKVEQGTMSSRKAAEAWFVQLSPKEQQFEEERLPALAHGRKEVARLEQFAER